jgi:hypothetical protein
MARIKDDVFRARHERAIREARILVGVGNDQGLIAQDGVPAERDLAQRLDHRGSLHAFEPLAGFIDE